VGFDKFYAPFSYRHGNIILSDARTHGPALGFTAKGTIDNNNDNLDLQGVIVPSYTINSLVGNVPLIGDLLIGGSGKGILALDYSIKGNSSDPSISANPLSVLTPGFLRNVFNIFDKPAPDMDKIEAERRKQKALESKKQ
ncbi:MAG: AsmA-like C-terminal region-containing protein, partial [Pseudomonadota bacterium]